MRRWNEITEGLDFAFQPIASFADGSAYGFEALLRNYAGLGFPDIGSVFDVAFEEGVLLQFDLDLKRKAFSRFVEAGLGTAKLFFNLDNRLFQMPGYASNETLKVAAEAGLAPSQIVFEISERHEPDGAGNFDMIIAAYRDAGFRIALDDFGSGFAGLKLLRRSEPDIVKIDRYFIDGIAEDPRKSAFLGKIAGLGRLMGITVVAEGVETERELRLSAEAGCDMVQGYYIAKPSLDAERLATSYPLAAAPEGDDRRTERQAGRVGMDQLSTIEPVYQDAPLSDVLARFRRDPGISFLPVVDGEERPVGVYNERDFRNYVYSPYGISVLGHLEAERGARELVSRVSTAPVGSSVARLVELYGASAGSGCLVLTRGVRYAGILPPERLLSIVAEREISEARDQNPLTRMPLLGLSLAVAVVRPGADLDAESLSEALAELKKRAKRDPSRFALREFESSRRPKNACLRPAGAPTG
jgi:EAL domain-containing protein (putative c-di-GMP-specific phosphodiesterase class I)